MTRSTYFDLGRSADARPGSESGYAQRFQCGNVVKRLIGTGMSLLSNCHLPCDSQLLRIVMHSGQSRRGLKRIIQPHPQIAIEEELLPQQSCQRR